MKAHVNGGIMNGAAAAAAAAAAVPSMPSSSSASSAKTMVVSWALLLTFCASNLWWFLDAGAGGGSSSHINRHHHHSHSVHDNDLDSDDVDAQTTTHRWCSMLTNRNRSCDMSRGQWVRDFSEPLYTNETCGYIHLNQNCMKNGRPDRDYMYWRWAPTGGAGLACDLPPFDASLFLRLMKGRRMMFVGDSIARNHEQALLCALAQVEEPVDRIRDRRGGGSAADKEMEAVWEFASYDFVLALAWSPFLVRFVQETGERPWRIYADEPDRVWTRAVRGYDVVVLSMTNWFFRTASYYVGGRLVSTHDAANASSIEYLVGMQLVWEAVLSHLVRSRYPGLVLLRSTSVAHFEGNPWDKGGVCRKTRPYSDPDGSMQLPWGSHHILNMQKDELQKARFLRGNASRPALKLLDVTYNTLLRPDAHPSQYRIQSSSEPRNDCVHWCMPGAIDSWNQLMLADPDIVCPSSTADTHT